MSSWKEKARNRVDILKSLVLMLALFWMPAYMAITTKGRDFKSEYLEYGTVFQCLCIMMWTGEFMDKGDVYGSIE